MPTRLYLPSSGATPVSPAFDAGWEDTSIAARLPAVAQRSSSTMTSVHVELTTQDNRDILFRQYIVGPLASQTIAAQAVKIQIRASETNTFNNLFVAWHARVVSADGGTVRGVLVALRRDTLEAAIDSLVNRGDSATCSAVTAQAGDYLVIEVGLGGDPIIVGAHVGDLRIGDAASSDLPEDDAATTDDNPWVEFANTVAFLSAVSAAATLSAAALVTAAGTRLELASGSLAAEAALIAAGAVRAGGASALLSQGTMTASGTLAAAVVGGAAMPGGVGAVVGDGSLRLRGAASLAAVASGAASGRIVVQGSALATGGATLVVAGAVRRMLAATLSSTASLAATPTLTVKGAAVLVAEAALAARLVQLRPHRILAIRIGAAASSPNQADVFGTGVTVSVADPTSQMKAGPIVRQVHERTDTTAAFATEHAEAVLRHATAASVVGEITVRPNVGQELYDVVLITHAKAGLVDARKRVLGIRLEYRAGRAGGAPRFEQRLLLGEP